MRVRGAGPRDLVVALCMLALTTVLSVLVFGNPLSTPHVTVQRTPEPVSVCIHVHADGTRTACEVR